MANIAKESTHWYEPDGTPKFTIVGKNGKERPTTLADAKKLGLLPSVTHILKLYPKPFLQKWIIEQHLMAALTLPRKDGETDENYLERLYEDADAQSQKARERGTAIHTALELALQGLPFDEQYKPHVNGAFNELAKHLKISEAKLLNMCNPEKSFGFGKFGGKVDLHSKTLNFVADFKSKEFDAPAKVNVWDDMIIQLVAYEMGLGMVNARLLNVFVSATVPGLSVVIEHSEDDIPEAREIWNLLVQLWYKINKL